MQVLPGSSREDRRWNREHIDLLVMCHQILDHVLQGLN